jgi:sterol desaturase/sphingolipid hydroxylase (fatty acid hydroxylase superfamily)
MSIGTPISADAKTSQNAKASIAQEVEDLSDASDWHAYEPGSDAVEQKKKVLSKIVGTPLLYWSGHVANWSFVLVTFLIGAWAAKSGNSSLGVLWTGLIFWTLGFFVWSISEYIFHRWAYHKNESFFAVGHLMHHDAPLALIGMPWLVNMVFLSVLVALFSLFMGLAPAAFLLSGFWFGHIWYTLVHHGVHHWNFSAKWFKTLRNHHKIHHKMPDKNLGVTTIIWDRIFRTRV